MDKRVNKTYSLQACTLAKRTVQELLNQINMIHNAITVGYAIKEKDISRRIGGITTIEELLFTIEEAQKLNANTIIISQGKNEIIL